MSSNDAGNKLSPVPKLSNKPLIIDEYGSSPIFPKDQ
jgi:hypothetical protein